MIVDSSVVIAILRDEPEAAEFSEILVDMPARMSAANWLEAAIIADRSADPHSGRHFDSIIEAGGITIDPVTVDHTRAARIAYRRYGRNSGSPAKLNFGDCFAYALAACTGEPLLFKGDDFIHTDILIVRNAG